MSKPVAVPQEPGGAFGSVVPRGLLARVAHEVAPELLGRVLVCEEEDQVLALRITEVEAYEGVDDPASHGWKGPTPRTEVMFGEAGHLYVYWIYGMHHAVNVVCGRTGESQAVLIRAGEIIQGHAHAAGRRPSAKRPADLARGPGRLTRALGIDRTVNGVDLCDPESPVRLHEPAELGGSAEPAADLTVLSGPRTGVSRAHETPWRFWIAGEASVSPYRRHTPRVRRA
ncbi:DNA-3-methyladenine glycosylase [Streptacidiphilus sp. MAP5-3]|uniref:DNA-3-methyladenine glycosylase n=1 Tax=unclassified Streptacidiphilus TaxID=2643834 RepID=UPI003513D823